jgi:hypothetical protein
VDRKEAGKMSRKHYTPEKIIGKLREAEVPRANLLDFSGTQGG